MPLLSQQDDPVCAADSLDVRCAGQTALLKLPESYPEIVSTEQISEIMKLIQTEVTALGQQLLSLSVASVLGLIAVLIYLILMPILIFFFDERQTASGRLDWRLCTARSSTGDSGLV